MAMEFSVDRLLDDLIDDMEQASCHLDDLFSKGYDRLFELVGTKLVCIESGDVYCVRELSVDYLHHLPGVGYLYGIRHWDLNVKGIFVYYSTSTITLT